MKKIITTLILILVCLAPVFAQKDTVTVISYNIRYNNPQDGDNIWENRRAASVNMVNMERPDFLCVQEAYYVQLEYLLRSLPGYDYIGLGRDDGAHGGEHRAMLYG